MKVQKRMRQYENVSFDKITLRIAKLCGGLAPVVDASAIAYNTIKKMYDGISTEEIDVISARDAEEHKLVHPDYSILAGRILVSNLHKTTPGAFSTCMLEANARTSVFAERHLGFIRAHAPALDAMVRHDADYDLDYFGYKTLENGYLFKVPGTERPGTMQVLDRPQYMYLRVAVAVHMDDGDGDGVVDRALERIRDTYAMMSDMLYTHATPTLFNACHRTQQLNSCFLLGVDDSIESIMHTVSNSALISKHAGGIGIHMHDVRSRGQLIRGTNGLSSGLVPQLKIYNETARTFNQGGKRMGAFAVYLEPWHGDIMRFLQMKLAQGADSERARDLFYALWVPDLFMQRARDDQPWSLFSGDTAPGLSDLYDGMDVCRWCNYCSNKAYNDLHTPAVEPDTCAHEYVSVPAFTRVYEMYERQGKAVQTLPARDVLNAVFHMQRESGTPYVCYKDHVNRQSNQKNLGTIKSSNLCSEIMEYSSSESYACCTLASINLRKFAAPGTRSGVDHEKLHAVVRRVARNLDRIIDRNVYPVHECERNSRSYRPIGIGVQGLANMFMELQIPFLGDTARHIDREVFETIYHAALTESSAMAAESGAYAGFEGSPASMGKLQFDLWAESTGRPALLTHERYDWDALKTTIRRTGLRNSLHVALMPTVSTSQIMGNNESFEPYASNIYTKSTLAGKFVVCNTTMIRHLIRLGLWNERVRDEIIAHDGKISNVRGIPDSVRDIYATVWEMKQSALMERAAARSPFVDQSQSLNIHAPNNSNSLLRSIMMKGWGLGLKTGSYYIRTQPASKALKNNIAATTRSRAAQDGTAAVMDNNDADDAACSRDCLSCGS